MVVNYVLDPLDNHNITFTIEHTFDPLDWKFIREFTGVPYPFLSYSAITDRSQSFSLHLKNAVTNDGHRLELEHNLYGLRLNMLHHSKILQDLHGETITSEDFI